MELLPWEDRQKLLRLLLELPNIQDKAVRDDLLSGLPEALIRSINISSPAQAHLNAMIDVVNGTAWARLRDNSWPIIQLIQNAISYVAESSLENDFQALREDIQSKITIQQPAKDSIAPTTIGQTISAANTDVRPNNLPSQSTPLIGRQQEVLRSCNLLRREDVRLLTLTGPGGTGKTRLSIEVAYQLLNEFEQGVFFVTLAPISDPKLVAAEIAQTYETLSGSYYAK
jgi:ATP-dependent Clp protease ATP-binding subunit ClpA